MSVDWADLSYPDEVDCDYYDEVDEMVNEMFDEIVDDEKELTRLAIEQMNNCMYEQKIAKMGTHVIPGTFIEKLLTKYQLNGTKLKITKCDMTKNGKYLFTANSLSEIYYEHTELAEILYSMGIFYIDYYQKEIHPHIVYFGIIIAMIFIEYNGKTIDLQTLSTVKGSPLKNCIALYTKPFLPIN